MSASPGRLLVVDDDLLNRMMLARSLKQEGYTVDTAENGLQALDKLRAQPYDVVLLDLLMPEIDGYQVLEQMKANPALRHLPVIVISALDEMDSILRCIEMGATDYLSKPFNPLLLQARVNASLASKRLHDVEHALLEQIKAEQEKAERLLLNILPSPVAERLKQGDSLIVEQYPDVTVLFADIVDFTVLAADMTPAALIQMLNELFSAFDTLAEKHGLEKIKTIGDAYMAASGLPLPRADHAAAMAEMALDMRAAVSDFNARRSAPLSIRIGMHSGPVVGGVIGTKKFIYDLWGDTVNTASRMESHGVPGQIHLSAETQHRLGAAYRCKEQGITAIKSKGQMTTYILLGRS
jgi:class 3 adenylate cyclase